MTFLWTFLLVSTITLPSILTDTLPDPILVGGGVSSLGLFPSFAFVRTPLASFCGAAVIHAEFVLTLAQCVYDTQHQAPLSTELVEIVAGDMNLAPGSYQRQLRDVREVIIHANYTAYNHRHDIALLRLDRPLQLPSNTVETVPRSSRIVPPGKLCMLPGWGAQRGASASSPAMDQRYLSVEIQDRDACNEVGVHSGRVRESMICGGNLFQAMNAPCSGNLGSPLYCDDQLVGLLSFGINCGLANEPPVFTQVRFYNRWIDEHIFK